LCPGRKKNQGLDTEDWDGLCTQEKAVEIVEAELTKVNGQLAKFETIKYFKIVPTDFTIESGELTPTLKLKRRIVTERYMSLLDSMYS